MSTAEIKQRKPGLELPPNPIPEHLRSYFPTDEEIEAILPKVELFESDGKNMDSDWHRMNIELLLAAIRFHFRGRDDYYASGNSIIYYSQEQARNKDFKGPDFFFVRDAPRTPERRYWAVWEQDGRYPDVIVELLSPTTAREDLTAKKDLYEKTFRTPDYYCFDREANGLLGWTLEHGQYQSLKPNDAGRLWCGELGLWLGTWQGVFQGLDRLWLRFFYDDGTAVPTNEEFALDEAEDERQLALSERRRAEAERRRAETERQRAETERQRAQAEQDRADQERKRADTVTEENARLKTLLAEKGITA